MLSLCNTRARCVPLPRLDYNSTGGSNKETENDSGRERESYLCLKRTSVDLKQSGKEEQMSKGSAIQGCPSVEDLALGLDSNPPGDIMERTPSYDDNIGEQQYNRNPFCAHTLTPKSIVGAQELNVPTLIVRSFYSYYFLE